MNFTIELLGSAFRMGLVGMSGVFMGMGIIYLASTLLHKGFPENKND